MAKGRRTRGKSFKRNMRKTVRSRRKMRKMDGGCGCNSNAAITALPTVIKGGSGFTNTATSDGNLPIRYYYGQNNYSNDPTDSSSLVNARNMSNFSMTGGSRKKTRKQGKRRKMKMMKGGDWLLGSSYSNNPFMTFGTADGAANSANLIYSNPSTNSSMYSQPALGGFSSFNPPLA